MIKIPRSAIVSEHDFANVLAQHQATLKDWQDHMRRVASDALNPGDPLQMHVAYPRPVGSELIESVMQDGGHYEVYDDGPTDEEKLEVRRRELYDATSKAMKAATDAVMPPAKMQLHELRALDIRNADVKRTVEIANKRSRLVESVKSMVGAPSPSPLDEAVNARDPQDDAFMKEHEARSEKIQGIHRVAMQAFADIEALTTKNVGSFKVPEFT